MVRCDVSNNNVDGSWLINCSLSGKFKEYVQLSTHLIDDNVSFLLLYFVRVLLVCHSYFVFMYSYDLDLNDKWSEDDICKFILTETHLGALKS